jgi:large-conductance mechanosensitive channel
MSIGLLVYKTKTDITMIDKSMLMNRKIMGEGKVKVFVLITPILNLLFVALVLFIILSSYEELEEFLDSRLQEEEEEGEDFDE